MGGFGANFYVVKRKIWRVGLGTLRFWGLRLQGRKNEEGKEFALGALAESKESPNPLVLRIHQRFVYPLGSGKIRVFGALAGKLF